MPGRSIRAPELAPQNTVDDAPGFNVKGITTKGSQGVLAGCGRVPDLQCPPSPGAVVIRGFSRSRSSYFVRGRQFVQIAPATCGVDRRLRDVSKKVAFLMRVRHGMLAIFDEGFFQVDKLADVRQPQKEIEVFAGFRFQVVSSDPVYGKAPCHECRVDHRHSHVKVSLVDLIVRRWHEPAPD